MGHGDHEGVGVMVRGGVSEADGLSRRFRCRYAFLYAAHNEPFSRKIYDDMMANNCSGKGNAPSAT